MHAYIPTKSDLQDFISQAIRETLHREIPEAIHKATRKQWLNSGEVMDLLDCSRRHLQSLRDNGYIKFSQHGRSIRYHINDVEDFLNQNKIEAEK